MANFPITFSAKQGVILAFVLLGLSVVSVFSLIVLPPSSDTRIVAVKQEDPLDIIPEPGRPIPPVDIEQALVSTPEKLKSAKAIYTNRCASCHGAEGLGNGPAGTSLNPPARNFVAESGWKNGHSLSVIFDTLSTGLGGMPSFDYLTPAERFALSHYVQSFGLFPHGPERADVRSYLEQKYKLSAGGFEPNRISIVLAQKLQLAEAGQPKLDLSRYEAQGAEAALVRSVIHNPERVAWMLSGLKAWQTDAAVLMKAASLGAPANGFNPGLGKLSASEVSLLHKTLLAAWRPARQEVAK